jgi:hypothetical protein
MTDPLPGACLMARTLIVAEVGIEVPAAAMQVRIDLPATRVQRRSEAGVRGDLIDLVQDAGKQDVHPSRRSGISHIADNKGVSGSVTDTFQ